jgi:tRNA modification GTPase
VIVEQAIASAIAAGARAAERGEFTRRAVLNGKLDLLQAEAVADLIGARMAAGALAAWNQLQGALSAELETIRAAVVRVLASIEADVDFTDDELPDADFHGRTEAIAGVLARLRGLLRGFASSRRQRDGLRVVFSGKPNAGKSSLVNRLLGCGRMIVSDEPGTTRDTVEEAVDLGGIAFVLTDTAGIREAAGAAEQAAVERAIGTMREADLRVLVIDAAATPDENDRRFFEDACGADTLVVLNKSDLELQVPPALRSTLAASSAALMETSARTGAGCRELADALVGAARERIETEQVGISRIRHRAAIEKALEPLERALDLAREEGACELAAVELRAALDELAPISVSLDNEEVLDAIFSEFCIGK